MPFVFRTLLRRVSYALILNVQTPVNVLDGSTSLEPGHCPGTGIMAAAEPGSRSRASNLRFAAAGIGDPETFSTAWSQPFPAMSRSTTCASHCCRQRLGSALLRRATGSAHPVTILLRWRIWDYPQSYCKLLPLRHCCTAKGRFAPAESGGNLQSSVAATPPNRDGKTPETLPGT